jgi:integrase
VRPNSHFGGAWPPPVYTHSPTQTERVRVWYDGRALDFSLGAAGSPGAAAEYRRLVAEMEVTGRPPAPRRALSLAEGVTAYLEFAKDYYGASQYHRVYTALRVAKELYGHLPVQDFGPLALKAVLRRYEERYARRYCNQLLGCVKRALRWLVSEELCPAEVPARLGAVAGLRRRHTAAPEREEVRPVERARVDKVLPLLSAPLAGLVRFQLHTGCRPGEACVLTPADLVRPWKTVAGVELWLYVLGKHKTDWKGFAREVPLNAAAQAVLLPFLADRGRDEYCFCPREGRAAWEAAKRLLRRSKVQPSQASRRKSDAKRVPGARYTTGSYRQAIERACRRAGVPAWHPNQIRHLVATEVEAEHGREGARCVLGHANPTTTAIYAEWTETAARVLAGRG